MSPYILALAALVVLGILGLVYVPELIEKHYAQLADLVAEKLADGHTYSEITTVTIEAILSEPGGPWHNRRYSRWSPQAVLDELDKLVNNSRHDHRGRVVAVTPN